MSRTLIPIAAWAALILATVMPANGAGCLSAADARQAVQAGEALRLGDLKQLVPGDIVGAALCDQNGQLIYRLGVMSSNGKVKKLNVDAQTGDVLN